MGQESRFSGSSGLCGPSYMDLALKKGHPRGKGGRRTGNYRAAFWPVPELAALFPELGLLLAALLAGAASRVSLGQEWKNNPRLPRIEGR